MRSRGERRGSISRPSEPSLAAYREASSTYILYMLSQTRRLVCLSMPVLDPPGPLLSIYLSTHAPPTGWPTGDDETNCLPSLPLAAGRGARIEVHRHSP